MMKFTLILLGVSLFSYLVMELSIKITRPIKKDRGHAYK